MENMIINHLAVFAAAISAFVIGGLWYSPALFAKPWMKANGFTEKSLEGANMGKIFGVSFVMTLFMAYNLAFFLGDANTDAMWGLTAGFLAGFGWAAMGLSIVAMFERRPAAYMFINGGYLVVALSVMGLIIGAWR